MFFYQKKSSRKIVHYSGCRYLRKHGTDAWGAFDSAEDARQAGYRICKCCSPIAKRFRKEENAILQYCAKAGLSCYQTDGQVVVSTPSSCWKIITAGKHNKLFLYHKNTNPYWIDDGPPGIVLGYHSQAIHKDTILEYLQYIVSHDKYRRANPAYIPKPLRPAPQKGTKRWYKERRREEYRKRSRAIRSTMALIDKLQTAH